MHLVAALDLLGGVGTREQLVRATSRAQVDAALAVGDLVRLARNRYASPEADQSRAAAHRVTGVVGVLSAAQLHGWPTKLRPRLPQIVVSRSRKLTSAQQAGIEVMRAELVADEVCGSVTSPGRTLLDCGRRLPFDEALAVWDSALRSGCSASDLSREVDAARGPGSSQLRRLAQEATGLAANPFESVLRSIALHVTGLHVRPQVPIYGTEFLGRPDLVDADLGVVLEADSYEWHGGRADLVADARRYNRLVVNGWLVLRFTWDDVMFDPGYVREMLEGVVRERTNGGTPRFPPA